MRSLGKQLCLLVSFSFSLRSWLLLCHFFDLWITVGLRLLLAPLRLYMFLTSSLICILTLYLKRTVVSTCVCIIWTFIVFCQLFSQSSGVWLLCATPAPAWKCQACQIRCLILHLLPGIIELWTCLYAAHGVPWRRHLPHACRIRSGPTRIVQC